jgi:hypothetical protein
MLINLLKAKAFFRPMDLGDSPRAADGGEAW